jgi:4'-phosphopantetheinyl transferase
MTAMHDEDELSGTRASAHADVWFVPLDAPAGTVNALAGVLDPGELEAAAIRAPRGRRRYVVAHAAQRAALGSVLGCPAGAVPLTAEAGGRTHVATDVPMHVNLTHSGDVALVVVSPDAAVGIDVERHDHTRRIDTLARRALSPVEHEAFLAVPAEQRTAAFYRLWARKEALLKTTGRGIASLRDVTATPSPPAFAIEDLAAGRDASAAVAGACWTLTITRHEWDVPSLLAVAAGG